jgi:hypothetical protein
MTRHHLGLQRPALRCRLAPQEETGIPRATLRLVRKGRPLRVDDPGPPARSFLVHPFLFAAQGCEPEVRLNWENAECRWVLPDEVAQLDTVPSLVRCSHRC